MKVWFVFFLGTIAYFIQKYSNRKDKANPSLRYYLKNNWSRVVPAFIFDLILMIIVTDEETIIDMSPILAKLPFGIVLSGKLLLSAVIGYGVAYAAYRTKKKKILPNE